MILNKKHEHQTIIVNQRKLTRHVHAYGATDAHGAPLGVTTLGGKRAPVRQVSSATWIPDPAVLPWR